MIRQKLLLLICLWSCSACAQKQKFVADDLRHFWKAYDSIIATKDSAAQYRYLRAEYLNKATPGLIAVNKNRRYSEKDFIDAIKNYPAFWRSLRANTKNVTGLYAAIEKDIAKLKAFYPPLRPATIYFLMGAFRSNGSTDSMKVLIGSELALADRSTVINELPAWRQPYYREYQPRKSLPLLCTHEYVHTQQKPFVENLLSMCIYEGVAEFISCKATGKASTVPAIEFGKANRQIVTDLFVKDLFTMTNNFSWLWGENRNELKIRDLGYYIGYEICERYYNLSADKVHAIKALIELDYTDEAMVEKITDTGKLLPAPLSELNAAYEKERPTVTAVLPLGENKKLKPGMTTFTVIFSEPLNGYHTGLDFGPLGESASPKLTPVRTWSPDKKNWTFTADLQPRRHYQLLISNNFRKENGVRLKPFLVEFDTSE